jgi:hypothetical protein
MCFAKKGPCFDWGMFQLEGYTDPIHGQIMMIGDLTNASIQYNIDVEPDEVENNQGQDNNTFTHLTRELWVVLHVYENELSQNIIESDSYFDSMISKMILLLEYNDFWMVSIGMSCWYM